MQIVRKNLRLFLFIFILYAGFNVVKAQGYQAINGSPYAGAAGIFNNPASSINGITKWDINLLGIHTKISSNAVRFESFALSNYDSSVAYATEGFKRRWTHFITDISLLNIRYVHKKKHAFSVGLRVRTYTHMKTEPLNLLDSITRFQGLLTANARTPFLQGYIIHNGWLEGNINYSTVLKETTTDRISIGATMNIMKSVSGAYLELNRLSFSQNIVGNRINYMLTGGSGEYAYSANYDVFNSNFTLEGTLRQFLLAQAKTNIGLSVGAEWLIKEPAFEDDIPAALQYTWKFGLSIMDIGGNKYTAGTGSVRFRTPNLSITDSSFFRKINGIRDANSLRDTLTTIFQNTEGINPYTIRPPARIILNIDKSLGKHFYVNADLNINLYSTFPNENLRTRELNMITVTPRWEKQYLGVYTPLQYNAQGQFWAGIAIKAGPLLAGIHDLRWLGKITGLNGGAYLMLRIQPFARRENGKGIDCPELKY